MSSPSVEALSLPGDGVRLTGDLHRPGPPEQGYGAGVAVLLHGGGQTRHSWDSTARSLATLGWTAITLDARGHGDSQWAPDGDYTVDAFVDDLSTAIEALDVTPVLIGASMGGMASLVAVGERRVTASGLVLVDIAPRTEASGTDRIEAFMRQRPEGYDTLDEVADAIAAYNPHRPRPSNLEGIRKNVRQGPDGRWRWHWDPAFLDFGDEPTRQARQRRLLTAAGNIDVPTLIVRGGKSDVITAEGVAELVARVPNAREIVVEGAGHMVAGDDNAVFAHELGAFLSQLASTSSQVP